MSIYSNYRDLNDLNENDYKKEYNIQIKQLDNSNTKEIYYKLKKDNKKFIDNSYSCSNLFNEKYIHNLELYGIDINALSKLKRKIENCKKILFYVDIFFISPINIDRNLELNENESKNILLRNYLKKRSFLFKENENLHEEYNPLIPNDLENVRIVLKNL